MKQVLTTISKGAGALLPILLVVSVSLELYARYKQRQQQQQIPEEVPDIDDQD